MSVNSPRLRESPKDKQSIQGWLCGHAIYAVTQVPGSEGPAQGAVPVLTFNFEQGPHKSCNWS